MKHSVLMIIGENLIYQCNPEIKPLQSTTEGVKDLAFWQQNTKNYLIKNENRDEFASYITDDNSKGEIAVPYEIIEIYFDTRANKNFAKMNREVKVDKTTMKVSAVLRYCKVCSNTIEVSVDNVKDFFPVCDVCLTELNNIIKANRNAHSS